MLTAPLRYAKRYGNRRAACRRTPLSHFCFRYVGIALLRMPPAQHAAAAARTPSPCGKTQRAA